VRLGRQTSSVVKEMVASDLPRSITNLCHFTCMLVGDTELEYVTVCLIQDRGNAFMKRAQLIGSPRFTCT